MPQARFGGDYLHVALPSMAAAYHHHPCAHHPFIDGNKRVAVAVADVFLRANGLLLDATDDEIVELTLGVANGTIGKSEVTDFYAARPSRSVLAHGPRQPSSLLEPGVSAHGRRRCAGG